MEYTTVRHANTIWIFNSEDPDIEAQVNKLKRARDLARFRIVGTGFTTLLPSIKAGVWRTAYGTVEIVTGVNEEEIAALDVVRGILNLDIYDKRTVKA